MKTKKAQFDFIWIFAIIVGTAILFLAIYGAIKAIDTEERITNSKTAKSISILTDPLQSGFAEGSFGKISFNEEITINNFCSTGGFGMNELSVSTKPSVGDALNTPGATTQISNKYIFSNERSSGEDYYVFSKPFYFPFKVADLLFLIPEDYCFDGAPDYIVQEIEGLNIPNIHIDNCTSDSAITVCFKPGNDCDIGVIPSCVGCEDGIIEKGSASMKYAGSLIYAAIFSEKRIYECNVERLLYRSEKISQNLLNKIDLMNARGCSSGLKSDLFVFEASLNNSSSDNLAFLDNLAQGLERKNNLERCGLW
jgi:hypothetical protein